MKNAEDMTIWELSAAFDRVMMFPKARELTNELWERFWKLFDAQMARLKTLK